MALKPTIEEGSARYAWIYKAEFILYKLILHPSPDFIKLIRGMDVSCFKLLDPLLYLDGHRIREFYLYLYDQYKIRGKRRFNKQYPELLHDLGMENIPSYRNFNPFRKMLYRSQEIITDLDNSPFRIKNISDVRSDRTVIISFELEDSEQSATK